VIFLDFFQFKINGPKKKFKKGSRNLICPPPNFKTSPHPETSKKPVKETFSIKFLSIKG
jgi:hypothetical protein